MSNAEGSADRAAFQALERTAGAAVERLRELHVRAREAEARGAEMQELLRRFTGDAGEADRLLTRLRALESENADLRRRLEAGREGVDRMLARIRFLEEQR